MSRKDEDGARVARRILERVARESEPLGGSSFARAARPVETDGDDRIERLGRRIGQTLGAIAAGALVLYLVANYFQPR